MHKEEDKLSLNMNEDFTLPNLEEGMEINEMPSIEDLISLDKDEVEKIQATEIADIFNENDNTNLFDDNIGENSSQNETTSAEFNSFDSNFEEMNLFDEDVALTLDEPNFNTSDTEVNSFNEEQNFNNQSEYDNDNSSEVFSAEESFDNNTAENFAFEENTQNSTSNDELQQENLNIDENIETETSSFDNEFDMGEDNEIPFENEDLEFSLNEQNDEETLKTDILDNEKEMSKDEKDNPSNEIDSLDKVEKIINEQNEKSNVTEDENINSIMEENTTTETIEDISLADKNSTYSKTDDVFAKIDSLLNDDSAFEVSSNTSNFENKSINGDTLDNKFRAVWAPELHYIKSLKNWFIVACMNNSAKGKGSFILRSKTGKPEGPYENIEGNKYKPIFSDIDGSLFEDSDGTVYFVGHNHYIAKMKPDMSDLAEELMKIKETEYYAEPYIEGAFIFKFAGKYHLVQAIWSHRTSEGDTYVEKEGITSQNTRYSYDCVIATSDNIYGPYGNRYCAITGGGHNNFFQDKDGNWWATCFWNPRGNQASEFQQTCQPGLIPMIYENGQFHPKGY